VAAGLWLGSSGLSLTTAILAVGMLLGCLLRWARTSQLSGILAVGDLSCTQSAVSVKVMIPP
jgi:hypothetical protein